MRFHPNHPIDNNKAQRFIWNDIKIAFERDEGVSYYRYPIFTTTGRGRTEPDFLIIHRKYGIWILESKGCHIRNIGAIEGHDWQMKDWYCESMSPVSQIEAQMYEVQTLVERDSVLRRLRLPFEYRVVLPFITKTEWSVAKYAYHPSTSGIVWLKEDLESSLFRQHVKNSTNGHMPTLSDDEWNRLLGVFRGTVSDKAPRLPIPNSKPASPSRIIHSIEKNLSALDEQQGRIAQEVPEGPQRIRGLAGTGKTILFARRIAQMHASHPEWNLAFVFFSRSLNQQIKKLVESSYRQLTREEPNWEKIHVWHAWGSKDLTGLYREIANEWGVKPLSLNQAKEAAKDKETPFEAACRLLEAEEATNESFMDAILIDEGQDLPAAFYRIAYRALYDVKRLYWAYDEAQGVETLIVPSSAEVFGRTDDGYPRVNLSGSYPSGMQKAHNMNRCYRTPRLILTAAHAINMGLLRDGGPLQGVTTKDDWTALGYQVTEGDFSSASVKAGKHVTIERHPLTSVHPVDNADFEPAVNNVSLLDIHITKSGMDDVSIVVNGIQQDLESGLLPEDIAVICLESPKLLDQISDGLQQLGIKALALHDSNRDKFRLEGHVTLSGIRRAKGNEAYKVYALNLHLAGAPAINNPTKEMVARNQAFVALTRTKLWCVAIGRDGSILQELAAAKKLAGRLTFPAFSQASLKRSMEDQDSTQREMLLN